MSVCMFALFESGILNEAVRDMMGRGGFGIVLVLRSNLCGGCIKRNNLRF